ncbi:MAG: SIS domain-containing protein [Candidatus Omnitrophica bacterium]|nr:SIS domain-containing protein [Candidatus Omnitrophota bacterium]
MDTSGRKDYFKNYIKHLHEILMGLDLHEVEKVVDCFLLARKNKRTIFFIGNGGSAATASHFAQDIGEVGRKAKVTGFKSLSLTDNTSLITAAANDHGYDKIFTVQLEELFSPGDVLVAISASGNSPNVVSAVEFAKKAGGITIGFIGFSGGKLKSLCEHVIHVKTQIGEYGPVEDVHLIMDHLIQSYLISLLSDK